MIYSDTTSGDSKTKLTGCGCSQTKFTPPGLRRLVRLESKHFLENRPLFMESDKKLGNQIGD